MTEIEFEADGRSKWWGYGDFYCDTPNTGPRILLPYQGEPAHGDSYHKLIIDSKTVREALIYSPLTVSPARLV
jgi:hypothetical protein